MSELKKKVGQPMQEFASALEQVVVIEPTKPLPKPEQAVAASVQASPLVDSLDTNDLQRIGQSEALLPIADPLALPEPKLLIKEAKRRSGGQLRVLELSLLDPQAEPELSEADYLALIAQQSKA